MKTTLCILTAALTCSIGLHAAEHEANDNPGTLSFYLENDLFSETDQQYTNGIRMSWVSPDISDYLNDKQLPAWVRRYNRLITAPLGLFEEGTPPADAEISRNLVITLGQQMYTPEDIDRTTVDPEDRPYAGWLYLGAGYHVKARQTMDSAIINLGVVGPASLAQEAQDFIHELRGFETFQGWDNQLSNELGIQLVYERKLRKPVQKIAGGLQYDIIYHGGASLGNVATYLNGGAEFRIGWHLPDDFGTSALRPGGDNSAPGAADQRTQGHGYSVDENFGLHGFVSIDGRFVLQDIFLDGNTFTDSHSVDKKPLVGDAAIGVSMLIEGWKISYAKVYRTKEFDSQSSGHSYGSLSASYSF